MKFIFGYLQPHKGLLAVVLICAIINQVFSLLDPQIFRLIIDNYVTNYQNYSWSGFAKGVGLLLLASVGVAMVSRIAKNIQDYLVNVLAQKVGMNLYQRTLDHLFTLQYRIFEDQKSGQILEKLRKARDDIQNFIVELINTVFTSIIGLAFVFIYALMVHRSIALFYGSIIPIMGLTIYFLSKKIKKAQKEIVNDTAMFSGTSTETLRNVGLIKSLGLEEQELHRLEGVNTDILRLEIKKIRLLRILEFLQGTLINFVRVCLMATMFYLVFFEKITLGEFFSLYFYSFFIFRPLYDFGKVTQSFQEAQASDSIINELKNLGTDYPISNGDKQIKIINNVQFTDVNFGYDKQNNVLKDITFCINQGERIAFVGPSGSGKSTIVKLLLGLYQPNTGKISVNNIDLQEIEKKVFRSQIGYVAQEAQLFGGTIRENLLFVSPEATDNQIIEVLKQAQIYNMLQNLDDGLDSVIGEGGLKLSGGQRQRIAIARALLRNPSLLIFDEATSSLDSIVESDITDTINEIATSRSHLMSIFIAHRLSTIKEVDRIYVIENGIIIETGTHEQLLRMGGLYQALWRQQTGKNS